MGYSVKIRQHDISDCGVACLASISAYYGLKLSLAKLRLFSNTDKNGTTIKGITEAARKFGFDAQAYSGRVASLYRIPKPTILHLQKRDGLLHFIVLYKIHNGFLHVMDPLDGNMHRLKMEELLEEWSGKLITMAPGSEFERGNTGINTGERLLKIIVANKKALINAFLLSSLYIITAFGITLFVKQIIDKIIPGREAGMLNSLAIAMLLLFLLSFFLSWTRSMLLLKTGITTDKKIIGDYIRHMVTLPQQFFDLRTTGEITSRVSDAFKIRSLVTETLIGIAISVSTLALSLALMFIISVNLAYTAILFVPLYYLIYKVYDMYNKKVYRKIMEQGAVFENTLIETIRTQKAIKYFGNESFSSGRTVSRLSELCDTLFKSGRFGTGAGGAAELVSRVLTILILWFGGRFLMAGELTLGELISFFTIISLFSAPLSELIGVNSLLREGMIAAERLFEIMELDAEPSSGGITPDLSSAEAIRFEGVAFSYPGRATIFKEMNIELRRGEITALNGESGSGKSTVAALIMRMYQPQSGTIKADGINIEHINLSHWRSSVSIVPQNPELFDATIMENIAPGEADPDIERILKLCDELNISEFVVNLPLGFETRTGENGSRLSRGQQQRIAMARALYRNCGILILDEATSSLDKESEETIIGAILREKEKGRIILMISHSDISSKISDKSYKI
jgi:ATP-binding cassette subfamily B protein